MIRDCMKRRVFSIPNNATVKEAATLFVDHHIGLLPVVDSSGRPVGVVRLRDLLSLELPDFFNLFPDLDFVHDFGAVETTRPSLEELNRPITSLMSEIVVAEETCGLLRAYAMMMKHELHDLPVVAADGTLVGIASRVDLGTAILASWKNVGGG